MKKITKKILSAFLALAMVLGVAGSAFISKAQDAPAPAKHKTKTIIHKVLMSREDFDAFNQTESDKKEKYKGEEIQNITQYFGNSAKEIKGVAFRIYKEVSQDTENAKLGNDESFHSDLRTNPDYANKYFIPYTDDSHQNGIFLTGDRGTVEVILEDGTYVVIEDKVASIYKEDGKQLTAEKAIPFKLELPITKLDGSGLFDEISPLHIYPKNTDSKPEVEKDFGNAPLKNEGVRSVNVGDEIPYIIKTTIPKDSEFKTVKWEDTMVTGLDFKMGSIVVKADFANAGQFVELEQNDYEVVETIRGFILKLKEDGLTKLETAAKTREVKFEITYKGILNETAVVETEIPNKVNFHYGNNPGFDTTPKSGKPNPDSQKIKVKKNLG